LWFTEASGNNIGRITTAGAITEYPIPTTGAYPIGITAGPDGALWFTEESGNNIGRITTAGAITEYPIPPTGAYPIGITAGPDGALWFTELTGNNIGRITTAGAITEYPLPAQSSTFAITAGPDGALWFTAANNSLGRPTTEGAITEYPIPTGAGPSGITVGPDGALWFTEDGEETGNEIGKAVLGFNPAAKNQAQQATPIRLGTSGSNVKDISIGSTTYCCTGTLGSLVQDASGNTYILSNNHVLARSNAAQIGEQIMQRGYTDTVPKCSTTGTIIVAKLSTFVPLIFG